MAIRATMMMYSVVPWPPSLENLDQTKGFPIAASPFTIRRDIARSPEGIVPQTAEAARGGSSEDADVAVGEQLREAQVRHREPVDQQLEKSAVEVMAAELRSLGQRLGADLDHRDVRNGHDARRALELVLAEIGHL